MDPSVSTLLAGLVLECFAAVSCLTEVNSLIVVCCYCEYLHRDLLFVTDSLKAKVSSFNGPNHQSHNVRMESATPPLRRRRERARRDKRGRKSHEGRRWRKRERETRPEPTRLWKSTAGREREEETYVCVGASRRRLSQQVLIRNQIPVLRLKQD